MRVFWAALFWIWGFLGLLFFIIDSSSAGRAPTPTANCYGSAAWSYLA